MQSILGPSSQEMVASGHGKDSGTNWALRESPGQGYVVNSHECWSQAGQGLATCFYPSVPYSLGKKLATVAYAGTPWNGLWFWGHFQFPAEEIDDVFLKHNCPFFPILVSLSPDSCLHLPASLPVTSVSAYLSTSDQVRCSFLRGPFSPFLFSRFM